MIEMNQGELQEILAREGSPLAVFFYTPLCGTCKAARRMLEVAAHLLPSELTLVSCNINFMPDIVGDYQIASVPALLVIPANRKTAPNIHYAMTSVERVLEYIRSVTSW